MEDREFQQKYEDIGSVRIAMQQANQSIQTTDIKGKDYAEVPQRVKAFRQVHPLGSITTEIVSLVEGVVTMKTTITDGYGKTLATGYAYEKEGSTFINKTSFIENCETSSVGRALGFCGFGIDNSIASAEEVKNAQANQKPEKKGNFGVSAIMKSLYTTKELEQIMNHYNVQDISALPLDIAQKYIEDRQKDKVDITAPEEPYY